MPLLLLKLLGIGQWLREAATAAFRWITASTTHLLIALLAVTAAWGVWEHRAAGKWHKAHDLLAAAIKAQEAAAVAKQAKQDADNLRTQQEHINELENRHAMREVSRRDDLGRFVAAHRLPQAAGGSSCRASDAGLRPDPGEAPDGQAPGDFVAVKPEQIDAWSEIELQNAERGQFLRGLVSQGLAVPQSALPEVEFGGK